jgi:hypothetical protein
VTRRKGISTLDPDRRLSSDPPPTVPTALRVDTSRWPLVVLTYAGSPTKEEMADHLREIELEVLGRRKPFAQVIDQRTGRRPDALQRAMIAAHQNQQSFAYATLCLGEAYVATKSVRVAMQGVFWVAKLPYPYILVDTLEEGIAWAEERLRQRGVSV